MKVFYHSADLDGHCSGAIVKYFNPECQLFPINYGDDFPWDSIFPDEIVYMVDFSLQPFDLMEKLSQKCELIWIDHHKTAIDEDLKRSFYTNGIRRIGAGACLLTWEYCSQNTPIPEAVQLLSDYDVWTHTNPKTLPFQYGFRLFEDTSPENQNLWGQFFSVNSPCKVSKVIDDVINRGNTIMTYESLQNAKFCKAYAFETHLKLHDQDLLAICYNKGFTSSQLFKSAYNPEKHDLMTTFCRLKLPKHQWTVSLYSTKENIDCGQIAKTFGGGGHKGAAGFQCDKLPFDY